MDRFIVASVQQRMRLPQSLYEFRDQQRRFLRAVLAKHARLVIFPELAGLMLGAALLTDFRASLLKRAERGRRTNASLWQKLAGSMANSAAGIFKANFQTSMAGLLDVDAPRLWQAYQELYGELARESGVTIVAPTAFLPDPHDKVIRNLTAIFGPSGELLGTQAKIMLNQFDQTFCQPGSTWDVVHTEVGALGIMIGSDVLYPEVGRVLAFQGAEVLVAPGACTSPALYNKLRSGILARMQDNQLFAVSAYAVGGNFLHSDPETVLIGKSAIFAPQELTPRFNGVLVEMGNQSSEGVLTAEWDFRALKDLWQTSETPLRRDLPLPQATKLLASLYQQLQSLPRLADGAPAAEVNPPPTRTQATAGTLLLLDDLPIIASVTSRWPLRSVAADNEVGHETIAEWTAAPGGTVSTPADMPGEETTDYEEETDEMDALAGSNNDKN